jgi:hypothetical protein
VYSESKIGIKTCTCCEKEHVNGRVILTECKELIENR